MPQILQLQYTIYRKRRKNRLKYFANSNARRGRQTTCFKEFHQVQSRLVVLSLDKREFAIGGRVAPKAEGCNLQESRSNGGQTNRRIEMNGLLQILIRTELMICSDLPTY